MTAFVASLLFVTLAEMGDKTQLLAMAFATRFPAPTVLAAVFLATLLNHALAVAAGRLLTTVIPLEVISFVAALSFILFGLWTIRGDTLEGEDQKRSAFGPFLTVAIAFFLAEIGDKTQLATISLAVKYENPMAVLFGTTTGMVLADGLGIILGIVLGKRLPDALIRLVSAGVFIGFGLLGAGAVLPTWLSRAATAGVLFGLAVATLGAAHALFLQRRRVEKQPAVAGTPSRLPRQLSQMLFAGLFVGGWGASLGLVAPLAAVDHWVAFALLAGLGWKLIHGAVRPRATPHGLAAGTVGLILLLAGLTGVHVVMAGIPWTLVLVPASLLLAAILILLAAPVLARRTTSDRMRQLAGARVAVASGLLLVGIAVQILIEHLV
jgi:putative Ca2+/H+ antiporter (TMEM165/GDT1 family)/putative Mn2+ efflux pump MntP